MCGISRRNFFKGGECETSRKSNFSKKKGKKGKFGQNSEFFEISDDKTDFTVGIVSRNLATMSNSETVGISRFSRHVKECGTLGTL